MKLQRRVELELRRKEINAELAAIRETKTVSGDPSRLEDFFLDELDSLEFELGIGHFGLHSPPST